MVVVMASSVPSFEDECPLPVNASSKTLNIINDSQHLTDSYQFQLAYEESLRKADIIIQEESTRRLKIQLLLLQDDNNDLNEQLAEDEERIEDLEGERDTLRQELEHIEANLQQHENDSKVQARELSSLKAEMASMNDYTANSAKLLTEKLALAREIANMKPELEHLRVQLSTQQTLLADKLALERQVSTLEVELETEKRAAKRAASKSQNSDREDDLKTQIDELKKELVKEKREKEKQQRTAEKESSEWESKKGLLEGKLDDFRTKLRSTKTQLKESQEALKKAEAASVSKTAVNPRKRPAVEMSADAAIGTPDGVAVRGKRPGLKRGKPDQTMLGEKSMFSITPFLNRTINISADTSTPEAKVVETAPQDDEGEASTPELRLPATNVEAPMPTADSPSAGVKAMAKKFSQEAGVLKEAKTSSVNKNPEPKRPKKTSTLDVVVEEEGDENEITVQPVAEVTKTAPAKKLLKASSVVQDKEEPQKKRRKLLGGGKTLFDEDDGDVPRRPAKVTLGARALGKAVAKGGHLAPPVAGFGAFSPLKKDRRGANASFLA